MAEYTANYGLHQWEPGDSFLRADFNEDFAKIDGALKAAADRAVTAPVLLRDVTAGEARETLTIPVQGLDLGQYYELRLRVWGAGNPDGMLWMRFNGVEEEGKYAYREFNTTSSTYSGKGIMFARCGDPENGGTVYDLRLLSTGSKILVEGIKLAHDGVNLTGDHQSGAGLVCGFDGLEEISLSLGSLNSVGKFTAGTRAVLLGYRF